MRLRIKFNSLLQPLRKILLELTSGNPEIDFYEYDDEAEQPGEEDVDFGV